MLTRRQKVGHGMFLAVAVAAAIALTVHTCSAQQPAPEKNYTLTLPLSDIQLIANILQDRPFKEVAALLGKMQQQIAAQEKPATPPGEPPK